MDTLHCGVGLFPRTHVYKRIGRAQFYVHKIVQSNRFLTNLRSTHCKPITLHNGQCDGQDYYNNEHDEMSTSTLHDHHVILAMVST